MALTQKFVSPAGGGAHDGTDEANAFSLSEFVTDFNANAAGGGFVYEFKQSTGYTSGASITLTADGTATSPNKLRGYNATPGDATLGRTSGGALNQSNMPTVAFGAGFRFIASGATHLIIEGIKFTGNVANPLVLTGDDSLVVNNVADNASSSASARGFASTSATCSFFGNDVLLANGASGSLGISTAGPCAGNRIKNASGTGIMIDGTVRPVVGNTIYESGIGIATNMTNLTAHILNNTIVNCSGDGIDIMNGATVLVVIVGNHITGCGGFGVDFNTSTCPKLLLNNRFRDNTSGAIRGDGDWGIGTNILNITSDDTDADDFTDASADDYSLKTGAAGAREGLSYLSNIGAEGTPAGSSGGYIIGS